jgi:two-component system, LuxR family, sensor histidine kinase DctS
VNLKISQKIIHITLKIAEITNALRNLSREDVDKKANFKIKEAVDESILLTDGLIKSSNILLELDMANFDLFGSKSEIVQVLINLIKNSIDSIKSNSGVKWIRLSTGEDKKFNYFSITDSGHGIPLDIREKIMTPFFTTKEVGSGSGLGLSLSHEIVRTHGGELYLDESCNNTRFIFKLPKI